MNIKVRLKMNENILKILEILLSFVKYQRDVKAISPLREEKSYWPTMRC
jgi:hypothetical protein